MHPYFFGTQIYPDSWVGVDLDGTLAKQIDWDVDPLGSTIGDPIPSIVGVVKRMLSLGIDVRVMTARVGCCGEVNRNGIADDQAFCDAQRDLITKWCIKHIGAPLRVTATKDFCMALLIDDRAITVEANTGRVLTSFNPHN